MASSTAAARNRGGTRSLSSAKSRKVMERLQKKIEDGSFYEAHQTYRALYQRFCAQGNEEQAMSLLVEGASTLLKHQQVGVGMGWELITVLELQFLHAILCFLFHSSNCSTQLASCQINLGSPVFVKTETLWVFTRFGYQGNKSLTGSRPSAVVVELKVWDSLVFHASRHSYLHFWWASDLLILPHLVAIVGKNKPWERGMKKKYPEVITLDFPLHCLLSLERPRLPQAVNDDLGGGFP